MKILIVTQKVDKNDPILGFFENWIREIALRAKEVKVIALAKGAYELPPNVKVVSLLKEKGAPKILQAALFYWHAFNFLRQVDGVFVHMAPEYVRAIHPLNIIFKRPIVMWYAHIKVGRAAEWAIERVSKILTPSKESFEFNTDKVESTGHGIDTEIFRPMLRQKRKIKRILSISRISRVKKIETLIEAAAILAHEFKVSDFKINIYGEPVRQEDDEYLTRLKNLIDEKGVADKIDWSGGVSNKQASEVYNAHDVFVRMQGGGGFGKTELEAMACGLPAILCTPVYRNDLGAFFNELYFHEGEARELACRIKDILNWDENKISAYAKIARSLVVEKHNVKNVTQAIVSSINTLTKRSI